MYPWGVNICLVETAGLEGECVKAEREVANAADKNAMGWRF